MRTLPLLVFLLLPACDQKARTAEPLLPAGPPPAPSRVGETCGDTAGCEQGLRCVAHACRKPGTSRLGDYHHAAGEAALDKGKIPEAVAALQLAVTQFDTDKVDAPAALFCAYGSALRRHKGDPNAPELAARMLHRCLLATPPGTPEYARAMRELVELDGAGLEPSLLTRDQVADKYLVRAPQKPSKLVVEVRETAPARDKGYAAWVAVLRGEEARAAMAKCYDEYWAATQKDRVTINVPLKLRAVLGDDDIYVGGTLDIQPDPGASGAEAAAGQCVKNALAPEALEFGKKGSSDSWSGSVAITLSSG